MTSNPPRMRSWPTVLAAIWLLGACGDYAQSPTAERMSVLSSQMEALSAGAGGDVANTVRRGLLNSPELRERAGLIGASIDQIAIERAALFPQLSIGIVGGRGTAGAGAGRVELSGEQLVFDFGGTDRAIAAADIELQINYQRFQNQVDESVSDLLLTYRQIGLLESVVEVRGAQLQAMRALYDSVSRRIAIGAQARPDLLEVRGRLERAEFEQLDARLELSELRDEMMRLAGSEQGGAIPDFPGSCRPQSGVTGKYLLAQLELAAAEMALQEAQNAVYPGISLAPIGRLDLGTGGVTTGINLGVNAAVFDGGAIPARVNQARNRLASAEAALQRAQRDMQLDGARLDRQIASLREKRAMLQRQIALQGETVALYRSQYMELGTRQITDLLDAEETLYERRVELLKAQFAEQEYRVACARDSGTLRPALGLSGLQIYGYPLDLDLLQN